MFELFLKFRESNYWYIFIGVILSFLILFLRGIKKKSNHKYRRYTNILVLIPWAFLVLGSVIMLFIMVNTGFSKDWLDNYMDILFIIGPIFIFILIMYAIRKEKSKNSEQKSRKEDIKDKCKK